MVEYKNVALYKIIYDTVDNDFKRTTHKEYITFRDDLSFDFLLDYLRTMYSEREYLISIKRIDTNTYFLDVDCET